MEISQDQLLREADYIAIEKQFLLDGYTLALCHAADLDAWDRIEVGKKIKSLTKVIQDPKETFTNFLQRLTSAVNRMIPNSEAR